MDTLKICKQCQQPLPENAPEGLCPACLAKVALGTEVPSPSDTIKITPLSEPSPGPRVAPAVAELAPHFPQLEIIELLGMGGMGMVYKARQQRLDRLVALKILPIASAPHPSFAERFNREARALAKLNHPGIVDVYDFGQTGPYYFFIMEFVDGMNLRQLLNSQPPEPAQALQLVTQVCTALQYAHDEGVVHRDIKPENILITRKGQVKIADFGLAKLLGAEPDTALTMSKAAMGTLNYMAPEQRENAQKVDHRADIYSLGVVFYEMLTGEVPMGKFEPPSSNSGKVLVDVRLDDVVLRALERKPERRYQQVSEVKTAVETIVSKPAAAEAAGGVAGMGGGAGGSGSPPPPPFNAAPGAPSPVPPLNPESLLARDYQLGIRYSIGRGWDLVKGNFWPCVGITALVLILLHAAVAALDGVSSGGGGDISVKFGLFESLLTGPMLGGLAYYFLKQVRRERATVETAFSGFSHRFLQLFLANVIMDLLIAIGLFCLVLPGIYLIVAWIFTLPLVIDKGLDFWPAMELSRKMVHKHWWKVMFLMVALLGVVILGFLACGVGIFIGVPVALAAYMFAYEDIFGNWVAEPEVAGAAVPPLAGTARTDDKASSSRSAWTPALVIVLVLIVGSVVVGLANGVSRRKQANWKRVNEIMRSLPTPPGAPKLPFGIKLDPEESKELNSRLEAAEGIVDLSKRDSSLASLAEESAKLGNAEIVDNALERIRSLELRNNAMHDAAVALAKAGLRAEAVELAKKITFVELRDKTLGELSQ